MVSNKKVKWSEISNWLGRPKNLAFLYAILGLVVIFKQIFFEKNRAWIIDPYVFFALAVAAIYLLCNRKHLLLGADKGSLFLYSLSRQFSFICNFKFSVKHQRYSLVLVGLYFLLTLVEADISLFFNYADMAPILVAKPPPVPSINSALSAALSEEVLIRGVLFFLFVCLFKKAFLGKKDRSRKHGVTCLLLTYILVSSVLFAFCHHWKADTGLFFTFLSGVILALLYLASGSLLLPFLVHVANDLPGVPVPYLSIVSGNIHYAVALLNTVCLIQMALFVVFGFYFLRFIVNKAIKPYLYKLH